MSQDKLVQIHQKLDEIQVRYEGKKRIAKSNREATIALIRFITDTVNTIAPGKVEALQFGSYTNRTVEDYPNVKIVAHHRETYSTLRTWYIHAGGTPPPQITTDDIMTAVLEGLNKVRV